MDMGRQAQGAWAFLAAFVLAAGAPAQAPDVGGPSEVVNPRQLLDDALKRFDNGDYDGATNIYAKVRIVSPNTPRLKLLEGLLLIQNKQDIRAISPLDEYNRSDEGSKDYRGFEAIGNIYKRSRMFLQAVPPLEKAKTLAPPEENGRKVKAEIAINLADTLYNMQRVKQAIEAAKDAEKLAPNDARVQVLLGQVNYAMGDLDATVKNTDRAVGLLRAKLMADPLRKPDYEMLREAHLLRLRVAEKHKKDKPDDATSTFEVAEVTRELIGVTYQMHLLDVYNDCLQALTKEKSQPRWMAFTASVEIELGALGLAQERLTEALRLDPENTYAQQVMRQLQSKMGRKTSP